MVHSGSSLKFIPHAIISAQAVLFQFCSNGASMLPAPTYWLSVARCLVLALCFCLVVCRMPTTVKARKRALDTEGATSADALRRLLSVRKISKTSLAEILKIVRDQPELASSSLGSLRATGDAYFEAVRRREYVPLQDRPRPVPFPPFTTQVQICVPHLWRYCLLLQSWLSSGHNLGATAMPRS